MKSLVVLSQSEIKKQAVYKIFSNDEYNITFVNVPDNPNRETQPLTEHGTKLACNQRIDEYLNDHNVKDEFIISIENGIMPIDMSIDEIMINKLCDYQWGDFCMIGVLTPDKMRSYFISPIIIDIDIQHSKPYFLNHHHKDNEIDTLGKYIAKYTISPKKNMIVTHNNWMKTIAGIDRIDQIQSGLINVEKKIKNHI